MLGLLEKLDFVKAHPNICTKMLTVALFAILKQTNPKRPPGGLDKKTFFLSIGRTDRERGPEYTNECEIRLQNHTCCRVFVCLCTCPCECVCAGT